MCSIRFYGGYINNFYFRFELHYYLNYYITSRVSRNYWQQQISLAYMKATLSNIVHKFHVARKNVFGPLAPQELYYFESFYGQV